MTPSPHTGNNLICETRCQRTLRRPLGSPGGQAYGCFLHWVAQGGPARLPAKTGEGSHPTCSITCMTCIEASVPSLCQKQSTGLSRLGSDPAWQLSTVPRASVALSRHSHGFRPGQSKKHICLQVSRRGTSRITGLTKTWPPGQEGFLL